MIKSIQAVNGQSIYDICLQAYGSLDLLIRLCVDNDISDLDNMPLRKVFFFDTNLILNATATGKQYATNAVANTGGGLESEDGDVLVSEGGDTLIGE